MNTMTVKRQELFPVLSKRTTTVFLFGAALLMCSLVTPGYTSELPAYPNATVAQSVDEERQNHPVITDRMKRVHGVVTSDGAQWLDGQLIRKMYLLPPGHTSNQGFEFYVNLLREQGIGTLFECRSYSCGASNFWANDIFAIPTLYGQDKEQAYFVGKKQGKKQDKKQASYYTVYAVRRGNGRIYTLIDVFTPFEHEGNGGQRVTGFVMPLTDPIVSADLMPFVSQMHQNPASNALLMIHGQMPATLAEFDTRLMQMEKLRQSLLQLLDDQGVAGARLRVNISFDNTDASAPFWLQAVPLP